MDETKNVTDIFSKLNHDLQNDFAVIRFVAGNIRKKYTALDNLENKIEMIHHALDRANERLQEVFALLK